MGEGVNHCASAGDHTDVPWLRKDGHRGHAAHLGHHLGKGFGYRVSGLGFRVWVLGLRVEG